MANRARVKDDSHFPFKVQCWEDPQIPLRTCNEGIRRTLFRDGIRTATAIEAQLLGIIHGGVYEPGPGKGLFAHIHFTMPLIEVRLRVTAASIRRRGPLQCWWLEPQGQVWWTVAEEDAPFIHMRDHPDVTNEAEIRHLFRLNSEVESVRVEVEASPNRRREQRWKDIHPY